MCHYFCKSLEAVCQFQASFASICKLCDQQREGLGMAGDPQWASIYRLETRVANQRGGYTLGRLHVTHSA
jgi:hypothetical protein